MERISETTQRILAQSTPTATMPNGSEPGYESATPSANASLADACPVCGGLGFVRYDVPTTHPEFGKLMACPNVAGHAVRRRHQLYSVSGLKDHEHHRLSDIINMNNVTAKMILLAESFLAEPKGWLYMWGGYGTGKSLVLMALVSEFIQQGRQALYITFADLLDVMRETFSGEPHGSLPRDEDPAWQRWDTYQTRFRRVRSVELLAIDEFDGSKVNETRFANEFRARLIDHRYRDALAGTTFTLFAGNDDPARLPRWIIDRIQDGRFTVWHNTAESVRPAMMWQDGPAAATR